MAAIALTDCTVTVLAPLAGMNVYKIVTAASADQADTIDVSDIFPNGWAIGTAQNSTDGNILLAVGADSTSITLPSGGTNGEARTIIVMGR